MCAGSTTYFFINPAHPYPNTYMNTWENPITYTTINRVKHNTIDIK